MVMIPNVPWCGLYEEERSSRCLAFNLSVHIHTVSRPTSRRMWFFTMHCDLKVKQVLLGQES